MAQLELKTIRLRYLLLCLRPSAALTLRLVVRLTGRSFRMPAPSATIAIALAQASGFMASQTWTLLMAWPILGERVRGRQWFAAASTLIGLLLIIEPWAMHSSLFSKFLGVIAALF